MNVVKTATKVLLGTNVISDTILQRLWLDKLVLNTNQILTSTATETGKDKLTEAANGIHAGHKNR